MNVFVKKGVIIDRAATGEEVHDDIVDFLDDEDMADGNIGARFKEPDKKKEDGALYFAPQQYSVLEGDLPEREMEEFYSETTRPYEDEKAYFDDTYVYEEDELATVESMPIIWLMECKFNEEEDTVAALFRMFANEACPFIAVFVLPSIKGNIFIEADWTEIPNGLIEQIYELDTIISVDRPGPVHIRRVSPNVWRSLVKVTLTPRSIQPGDWRRLRFAEYDGQQRLYRDEVALVVECSIFYAIVLIVPLVPRAGIREGSRFENPKVDYVRMLFNREELNVDYHQETIENNSFECGLWIRRVPLKNIERFGNREITQSEFLPFATSRHPSVVSYFPRVLEWVFHEGEEVAYWWDETVTGVIVSISDEGTKVVADDGTECELEWALLKLWTEGSEVVALDGYTGVVQSLLGNSVEVWDMKTQEPTYGIPVTRYFHANALARAPDSLSLNPRELLGYRKRRQMNPWKDMAIRVVAGPSKGRYEFVDTIPGANTKSTFKALVRSAILNSQALRTVDYDWVVCEKTGFPLHKVRQTTGWILKFPPGYMHPYHTIPAKPAPKLTLPPSIPPPEPVASTSYRRRGTPPALERHESQRWLWDLNTIGYKFKVTILREDKNIKVHLCVDEAIDAFSIKRVYWNRHNKDHELHPLVEIVPEYPTRKAEKPYFVTRGEHKGKTLARAKGSVGQLLSLEVDVLEGTVKSDEYHIVDHSDCCMMVIEPGKWKLLERALDPYRDEMSGTFI